MFHLQNGLIFFKRKYLYCQSHR